MFREISNQCAAAALKNSTFVDWKADEWVETRDQRVIEV